MLEQINWALQIICLSQIIRKIYADFDASLTWWNVSRVLNLEFFAMWMWLYEKLVVENKIIGVNMLWVECLVANQVRKKLKTRISFVKSAALKRKIRWLLLIALIWSNASKFSLVSFGRNGNFLIISGIKSFFMGFMCNWNRFAFPFTCFTCSSGLMCEYVIKCTRLLTKNIT